MLTLEQIREQVDLLAAQLGDDHAFVRLAERYHPRLLHYVRRLVRDRGTADDVLQETWVAAQVYRCLDRISQPHAEVLVLCYVDGLSHEEIAAVTGCKLGTVRSRLHYAKRALREAMEADER